MVAITAGGNSRMDMLQVSRVERPVWWPCNPEQGPFDKSLTSDLFVWVMCVTFGACMTWRGYFHENFVPSSMASNSEDAGQAKPGEKRGLDLGWLAGSAVLPSKRREIEGVGMASIMELQAQLYQAQERMKQEGEEGPIPAKVRRGGLEVKGQRGLGGKNTGVDERHQRDMQHVKTSSQRISEAYAALERKAALYEKLASGAADDLDDKYEVDFLTKSVHDVHARPRSPPANSQPSQPYNSTAYGEHQNLSRRSSDNEDGGRYRGHDRENSPQQEVDEQQPRIRRDASQTLEELEEAERRQKHREVVMQLAQQTKEQRERAVELKQLKEQQAQRKVDKLKSDFLKRQLSKLAGNKQTASTSKPAAG